MYLLAYQRVTSKYKEVYKLYMSQLKDRDKGIIIS